MANADNIFCIKTQPTSILPPELKSYWLNDNDANYIGFEEELMVIDRKDRIVGTLRIKAKKIREVIDVVTVVEYEELGASHCINYSGVVDRNFNTLVESRKEYSRKLNSRVLVKRQLLIMGENCLFLKCYRATRGKKKVRAFSKLEEMEDFVSESANVLLLRQLAAHFYTGQFRLTCVTTSGERCTAHYTVREVECPKSDCRTLFVVFRNIDFGDSGVGLALRAVLTPSGQLLRLERSDSPFVVVTEPQPPYSRLAGPRLLPYWRGERIHAKLWLYLNEIEKNTFRCKSYMADHPEVNEILSEFLNGVLVHRPTDVLGYAKTFFTELLTSEPFVLEQ